jgi:hypothetical protein
MPKLPMHRRNTKFRNIKNQIIYHFEFLVSVCDDESSRLTATVSYNQSWASKILSMLVILTVITLAIKWRPDNRGTRRKRWQLITIPWLVVVIAICLII